MYSGDGLLSGFAWLALTQHLDLIAMRD